MDKKKIVEVTKIVLDELEKRKVLKREKMSPYKKTEMLLYNYRKFKEVVNDKEDEIEEIVKFGLKKKAKSVVVVQENNVVESGINFEECVIEEKVRKIEDSITYTKRCIESIDKALKKIEEDKYYEVIERKYIKGQTLEEVAFEIGCDVSTVSRNRNRLVKDLAIILFSDDVIYDLFHV